MSVLFAVGLDHRFDSERPGAGLPVRILSANTTRSDSASRRCADPPGAVGRCGTVAEGRQRCHYLRGIPRRFVAVIFQKRA